MVNRFKVEVIDRHPEMVVILAGIADVTLAGSVWGLANRETCHDIAHMVGQARANSMQPNLTTMPPWERPKAPN
jgi:hypothetical protein